MMLKVGQFDLRNDRVSVNSFVEFFINSSSLSSLLTFGPDYYLTLF